MYKIYTLREVKLRD